MNEGGIVWIGGVRVAEMIASANGGKTFTIKADKITNQLKQFGLEIDGSGIVTAHKDAMDQ